jgi:hypothetical protein
MKQGASIPLSPPWHRVIPFHFAGNSRRRLRSSATARPVSRVEPERAFPITVGIFNDRSHHARDPRIILSGVRTAPTSQQFIHHCLQVRLVDVRRIWNRKLLAAIARFQDRRLSPKSGQRQTALGAGNLNLVDWRSAAGIIPVTGAFMLAYMVMNGISGPLSDRIGAKIGSGLGSSGGSARGNSTPSVSGRCLWGCPVFWAPCPAEAISKVPLFRGTSLQ